LKSSKTHAYREYAVWNDIYTGTIKADILVMGSSRAWRHIDPTILEDSTGHSAYNLGMDGQHLPMQLWRYNTFLEKNKRPSVIIYSLDIFMLSHTNELFNKDQFLPYMLFNDNMENYLQQYQGFDYYDYKIPFIRYCGAQTALLHTLRITVKPSSNKNGRVKGFYAEDKTWNNDFEKVKQQMNKFDVSIDSNILKQFDEFLSSCEKNGTKVVLVYSPEYIEGQAFVKNRKEVMATFTKLADKHTIPFFDYSSDALCDEKSFFYNATHLNRKGAHLFSEKLSGVIKNYLNKSNTSQ
jgi:hypothetical protein